MKLNYTELIFLVNLVKEECKRARSEKINLAIEHDRKVLEAVAEGRKHPEWTAEEKNLLRDTMVCSYELEYQKTFKKLELAERLYAKLTEEDFEVEVDENED